MTSDAAVELHQWWVGSKMIWTRNLQTRRLSMEKHQIYLSICWLRLPSYPSILELIAGRQHDVEFSPVALGLRHLPFEAIFDSCSSLVPQPARSSSLMMVGILDTPLSSPRVAPALQSEIAAELEAKQ
jgi:hypothetical protein